MSDRNHLVRAISGSLVPVSDYHERLNTPFVYSTLGEVHSLGARWSMLREIRRKKSKDSGSRIKIVEEVWPCD